MRAGIDLDLCVFLQKLWGPGKLELPGFQACRLVVELEVMLAPAFLVKSRLRLHGGQLCGGLCGPAGDKAAGWSFSCVPCHVVDDEMMKLRTIAGEGGRALTSDAESGGLTLAFASGSVWRYGPLKSICL